MSDGHFVYTKVKSLEGKPKVFGGQCAGLVQWYTKVGKADTWREGIQVRGNASEIVSGTAVATFENGVYPNRSHGNHAALYISQDSQGIWVMDQWTSKPSISKRKMLFRGKNSDGSFVDPSNNGDALSVIIHE
ncbi:BPSL0067 family protein [Neptunomonas phycophila]|uniref:BPSL0067 family protein n=1 Tax=Neptunomonas phycophila TaxID=1572645 RepID=A0AAW7XPW0_9GAMM|nr:MULTISPECIES: BPSL0067 family protein [Neptunomonas]MDN2658224.1 BPSL0067 family protein [Neptunomonas sp. CHC150]MDO6455079.1 BPSL0067 family protein [Neptunomonas phycophila]MDO6468577.1 BPSL0067 family protein [Neptunomonas phycophila]MDP2523870.1 BPSL0067 family protein [Neptunomonas phycophila]